MNNQCTMQLSNIFEVLGEVEDYGTVCMLESIQWLAIFALTCSCVVLVSTVVLLWHCCTKVIKQNSPSFKDKFDPFI
eukprot:CAMPEP_0201284082 /NCGR_PEP_ID=MMETSP1317-20130820/60967_1 /ASSEMBLY_ACC=CAM_ASM_000770 /TAXON_ID=187299 /ORGANISM="Undescribed Undescribed, Strain Undescribed" /LENGTH=76 /DNA_ID=CAMNT_0047602697 /DNA_START=117 /DNA_END=347 /DNA_ORIENTATION=-